MIILYFWLYSRMHEYNKHLFLLFYFFHYFVCILLSHPWHAMWEWWVIDNIMWISNISSVCRFTSGMITIKQLNVSISVNRLRYHTYYAIYIILIPSSLHFTQNLEDEYAKHHDFSGFYRLHILFIYFVWINMVLLF